MRIYLSVMLGIIISSNALSQTINCSISFDTLCNKGFYQIDYVATGNFGSNNYFYLEVRDQMGNYYPYPLFFTSSTALSATLTYGSFGGFTSGPGMGFRVNSTNPAINGIDSPTDAYFFIVDTAVVQSLGQLTATTGFPGTQYQWLDCSGSAIQGEINPTLTTGAAGVQYAVEINQSGCIDTSGCYNFQIAGIEHFDKESISLYPVPVENWLVVSIPEGFSDAKISISDLDGRKIQVTSVSVSEGVKINTDGIPSGSYILIIEGNSKTIRERFVK